MRVKLLSSMPAPGSTCGHCQAYGGADDCYYYCMRDGYEWFFVCIIPRIDLSQALKKQKQQ